MTFRSILFERTEEAIKKETPEAPVFFVDLNLDQVIAAITVGKEEYNLQPFFYTSLTDIDAIKYRHEIFRDLENEILFEHIKAFAQKMRAMREHLVQANKLYYKYQKELWFLDGVDIYCDAINCLSHDLTLSDLQSRGFLTFREYLTNYTPSGRFTSLLAETKKLKTDLCVNYCVLIKGYSAIQVRKYGSEINYSADVEATFAKFQQGAVKDYAAKLSTSLDMNHVEARVLDFLARLYSDIFLSLDGYCAKNVDYLDETIHPLSAMIFTRKTRSGYLLCPVRTRAVKQPLPAPSDSCIIWPALAVRFRAWKRNSFCSTGSSRILKEKKT